MLIVTERIDDLVEVEVTASVLDASNSKVFRSESRSLAGPRARVLLDMQKVEFMDSSGLGSLLSFFRALEQNSGQLKIFGLTGPARALIELVRMHKILSIYNDREEGRRAFSLTRQGSA